MAQNIAQDHHYKGIEDYALAQSISVPKAERWTSLDLARGLAITLMILSHCVKGLLAQPMIPNWGLVPLHLMTKFSSSLFVIVFGIGLSLYFIPHVKKESWSKKRFWLIKRGLELMIWYKLLTVVQMFQFYPKAMIIDTLLFKSMPDFVEILGFYSIILLWIPFLLPKWSRMSFLSKFILIVGTLSAGQWLHHYFDFWGMESIKAILVENKGYYTFGQFQRGALVFLGLFIGDLYKMCKEKGVYDTFISLSCLATGSLFISYFYFANENHLMGSLYKVASNVGKHPFDINFLCFSLGGALFALGLCLLSSQKIRSLMFPIVAIGQHSLLAFNLHIIIIFYLFRYKLNLHHAVTYPQSLLLSLACFVMILMILPVWKKSKAIFS